MSPVNLNLTNTGQISGPDGDDAVRLGRLRHETSPSRRSGHRDPRGLRRRLVDEREGEAARTGGRQVEPPPSVPMSEVLVAAAELRWARPSSRRICAGSPGRNRRSPRPDRASGRADGAEDAVAPSSERILANEPIRPERMVKAGSGFMSAILPPGMLPWAITTDTRGSNSAGGFILTQRPCRRHQTSNEGSEQFARPC